MKLEPRLFAIFCEINANCHVDVGSDHGLLAQHLLESGRANRVIAIEKNKAPFEHSCKALKGYAAEVRLGDGLTILKEGEADSLSMSGLGTNQIIKVLEAFPERVPSKLVLQANDKPERLRRWAFASGFHVINEEMVEGFWRYVILSFKRVAKPDPAYEGLPEDLAMQFGPLLLKRRHSLLLEELKQQHDYLLAEVVKVSAEALLNKLELVKKALALYQEVPFST